MSSKFQVVVPKEIRERYGFQAGDRLAWFEGPAGLQLVRVRSWQEQAGSLSHLKDAPFEREKDFAGGEFT
jgi:AbrB family looped-hinge helix DNA binding protein